MKAELRAYVARLRDVVRREPDVTNPKTYVRALGTLIAILSGFALVFGALWWSGVRVSLTGSLPEGVYAITPAHHIERFDLVVFCPPPELVRIAGAILEEGPCPLGRDPLLKMVVGLAGDTVRLSGNAVVVNGVRLPGCGVRFAHDSFGRRVPSLPWRQGVLPTGTVFLCGLSDRSWDSRYFGPIKLPADFAKAAPLVTRDWGWGRANAWRKRYIRRYPKDD